MKVITHTDYNTQWELQRTGQQLEHVSVSLFNVALDSFHRHTVVPRPILNNLRTGQISWSSNEPACKPRCTRFGPSLRII